jgi:glycosyltransferase involved in cell wall biosynthesis
MLLSVIIPCYNEEEVIEESYKRLVKVMKDNKIEDFELIFVNDGSKDKTFDILCGIAANDKKVKVISFSRNFGHQPAVAAGINNCNGEYAVIIDADLQDPPELIPQMLKLCISENANVVYGVRKERKGETFFKKLSAKLFYRFLNKLSEVPIPLDTGDFRLIDKKMIDVFKNLPERNKFIRGLISWAGFKQIPFYYVREPRFAGETKYPLKKMIRFALTGIMYFSKKPPQDSYKFWIFFNNCGDWLDFICICCSFHRDNSNCTRLGFHNNHNNFLWRCPASNNWCSWRIYWKYI